MYKFFVLIFIFPLFAEDVAFDDLPHKAQNFIHSHYATSPIEAMVCEEDYRAKFVDGLEIEFWRDGALKSIHYTNGEVLADTSFVPRVVLAVVQKSAPDAHILAVNVLGDTYRVQLDNQKILIVNDRGRLLDTH